MSGNDESYVKLEKKLATHKSQSSALIFPTGYMANLGVISVIANKNDLILSDELNHASIIEACKLSGAKISVYRHNDMNDLKNKLHREITPVIASGIHKALRKIEKQIKDVENRISKDVTKYNYVNYLEYMQENIDNWNLKKQNYISDIEKIRFSTDWKTRKKIKKKKESKRILEDTKESD